MVTLRRFRRHEWVGMERTRHLTVLGGMGISPPDRFSGIGRRVVAHLAVRGPRQLRSLLCAGLWPDVPDERAKANLRRALWQLPDGWVVPDGPDLRLDAAVDLDDARRVAGHAIRGGRLTWDEVDLLSHDLLPGWFEDWVVEERECFALLRVQALEAACRSAAEAGDYALSTQAGSIAVRAEPLRESAVMALVEAHLGEGNLCLAVRQYRAYADLLRDELGVSPGGELAHLVAPLLRAG
jgi:DNA-binding SARP family transcriptional activator